MQKKVYFSTVGVLFSIIAVLHFLRMAFAWEAFIGGWRVPMWISGLAVVIAVYLVWQSFKFRRGLRENSAPSDSAAMPPR